MKLGLRIIKNVFSMWAYYLIAMVIGFFLMPFMISHLGNQLYGLWILMLSVTGYMHLLDFGLAHSATKYVAEYKALNDQKSLNQMISTFFFSYAFIGLVVLVLAAILALFFDNWFNVNISNLSVSDIKLCVFILGLNMALVFPLTAFSGIIRGWQRYDLITLAEIVLIIIKTGLIVLALFLGFGLVALALVTLFSTLLGQLCRLFFARKLNPDMKISLHLFNRQVLKKIWDYSIFAFIISSASQVVFTISQVITGIFLTPAMVAFYVVGSRLPMLIRPFISAVPGVLVPTISDFNARENKKQIEQLLHSGTKYSLILILPSAIFLIVFRKPFIELWIGKGYEISMTVMAIIFLSQIFYLFQNTGGSILFGIGKLKFKAMLSLFEIVLCLTLNILLIKQYGIIGAALALAIPLAITNILILPAYICRVINTSLFNYIKSTVVILLPVTVIYTVSVFGIRRFALPNSLITLGLLFAGCIISYFVAAYYTGLRNWERESFVGYVKVFLNRSGKRKEEYAEM